MNEMETKPARAFLTIAVTGSAGSGKSTVCRRFAHCGGHLIDADQVARDVVAPGTEGLKKVVDHFGPSVLMPNGMLNRAALRRKIVTDSRARKALEAMVHPEILAEMAARMATARGAGHDMVIVEVPLLFELGMASRFDRVVFVKTDRNVKIKRLMERDNVSKVDAEKLLDLQMPDVEKEKKADFIIENNGSVAELIKNVDCLYEMIYRSVDGCV